MLFWYILAGYVAGMFIVGIPIGRLSLAAWKYRSRGLGLLCFPLTTLDGRLGDDPRGRYDDWPVVLRGCDITRECLESDSQEANMTRGKYIFSTGMVWPFRLVGFLITWIAIVISGILNLVPKLGGAVVAKCKRCTRI